MVSKSTARRQLRAVLEHLEPAASRSAATGADLAEPLGEILLANNDISDAIDTISNAETIPDLEDIASIQAAARKIGRVLDVIFRDEPKPAKPAPDDIVRDEPKPVQPSPDTSFQDTSSK